MISDWRSEDGRKAIEKMGWPEWGCPRSRLQTCGYSEWEILQESGANFYHTGKYVEPCVALALLRDRARGWLEENTDGWSGGLSSGGYAIETYDADTNEWTLHSTPQSDWDGCLIIAVLATEGSEPC